MKRYISLDLYVIFDSKDKAEAYARKNGLAENSVSNKYAAAEGTYAVIYRNMLLPVSEKFRFNGNEKFDDFVRNEFKNSTFADVTLNEMNEIAALDYNNSVLSYR